MCDTYLVILGLEEKVLWLEISMTNIVLIVAVFDGPVVVVQHSQLGQFRQCARGKVLPLLRMISLPLSIAFIVLYGSGILVEPGNMFSVPGAYLPLLCQA